MSEPQKGKNIHERHGPAFSVQDEIRRDRSLRKTSRRRSTRHTAHRLFTMGLCILVCAALLCVVMFFTMRVDTITVSGNVRYSAEEIMHASGIETGDFLPFIHSERIYRNIVTGCTHISRVELVKSYPSSIEIIVSETGAVYALQVRNRWLTLDENLRVIEYTEDISGLTVLILPAVQQAVEGLPLVFVDSEAGTFVDTSLDVITAEMQDFRRAQIDLSDKYNLRVWINGDAEILLGDTVDLKIKLQLARKVYEDARTAGSSYTAIDASDPTRISAAYDADSEY